MSASATNLPVVADRLEALTENFNMHVEVSETRTRQLAEEMGQMNTTLTTIMTQQQTLVGMFKLALVGGGSVIALGGLVVAIINLVN